MIRPEVKIVAFCGKMGAGKTEAANHFARLDGFRTPAIKFAQPIYDILEYTCDRVGVNSKDKNRLRPFMQDVGMFFRKEYGEEFWVKQWERNFEFLTNKEDAPRLVLCDDCRFDNEAEMLRLRGATIVQMVADPDIRKKRGVDISKEGHASEAGIDPKFISTTVVNNGSKEQLYERLSKLYEALRTTGKV